MLTGHFSLAVMSGIGIRKLDSAYNHASCLVGLDDTWAQSWARFSLSRWRQSPMHQERHCLLALHISCSQKQYDAPRLAKGSCVLQLLRCTSPVSPLLESDRTLGQIYIAAFLLNESRISSLRRRLLRWLEEFEAQASPASVRACAVSSSAQDQQHGILRSRM